MNTNYIREKIRSLRIAKGITQKEMGERLYMDERTYGKIERGEKKSMDILLLTSIADKLNVDLDVLLVKEKANTPGPAVAGTGNPAMIQVLIEAHEVLTQDIRQLKEEIRRMILSQQEALRMLRQTEQVG
ncbi:helix-turn-helix domain-containing protein [Taibaiella chishuiensis]|uniref:Helix-turn-helix protein n=1 Tax=Taibaiella chishuiensis TaxID=1434707 RepID=A0A2P8D1U8_9BACT|nr:helix-turn-helix transcriptional regulator [Taibaiella chishuiensis]PSK91146.1 helix-turn-helix protein [Taibaiella chishuiensis]